MTKQPKNICKHCATELRATFVHRMTKHGMASQPGFECPRCLALYDTSRTELSAPLRKTDGTAQ